MKFNKVVFAVLSGTGLFLVSCLNEKPAPVEIAEPEPVETFVSGKILSRKADLCLLGRDSKMHPVLKLYAGDNVSVLEIDGEVDSKFIPDEDKLTNDSSKSVASPAENAVESADEGAEKLPSGRGYVHVVHDNLDFWLENSVFALNCENAVAIEKTYLYSDSALTQKLDGSPNPLKFSALIAIALQESENDSESLVENTASVKVFYYDTEKKSVREAWVSAASVSSRKDDIVVSQIAEELKVTKRAVPRNELFKRAAKYKPCDKVLAVLNAQKEEKKTYSYQQVLKSVQRMNFGVNVDELMTVDQTKDPFK